MATPFGVWIPAPADGSTPRGVESAICRYTTPVTFRTKEPRTVHVHELWCDTGVWAWDCDGSDAPENLVPLAASDVIVTHYMLLPSGEV